MKNFVKMPIDWYLQYIDPIQNYIFAVKKSPRKCKLLNDWKVWYQCEAKNATQLHAILAFKTNLTKAVHLLQAK